MDTYEKRAIPGFNGYFADTEGNIFSIRNGAIPLKTITNAFGYFVARIYRNGKTNSITVHKLILNAFIGPRPDGGVCRHLDGNKANNKLSNLAWGTQQQNMDDRERHGTVPKGSAVYNAKLSDAEVEAIKISAIECGVAATAKKFGVARGVVGQFARGLNRNNVRPDLSEEYMRTRFSPLIKLTEKNIFEIKKLFAEGISQSEIARRFNTVPSHVSKILSNQRWVNAG